MNYDLKKIKKQDVIIHRGEDYATAFPYDKEFCATIG
jgi:hypothetical protein